jgi:hypothetical protein
MSAFREFTRIQVEMARDLLLVHPDEDLETVIPHIRLRDIKDNLARAEKGWNFLQDIRNRGIFAGGDKMLLDHVISQDWLRDEFLDIDSHGVAKGRLDAASGYLQKFIFTLLRLALLSVVGFTGKVDRPL